MTASERRGKDINRKILWKKNHVRPSVTYTWGRHFNVNETKQFKH